MTKLNDPKFQWPHQEEPASVSPTTRRSGALLEEKSVDSVNGRQRAASSADVEPPRSRIGSNVDAEPSSRRGSLEEVGIPDLQVILRVVCEAGSDILESTHAYVTALTKAKFRPAVAERVSLSCWELLSNALSYGSVRRPVILELVDLKSMVELRVTNDSIAARCQMLEQRIDQLKRDAKGTYLQEMRRSVSGGLPRATLGLARVAHEGKMDLTCSFIQNRVQVVARCTV
jgi:hypothetical protein